MMQRFDYVRIMRRGKYGAEIDTFGVFDRHHGCTDYFAYCDERDDAERIVTALNETTTKPSDHTTTQ